ncbi:hypothetical protein HYPSUDRAFT_202485 [Hypholoma sublateritium FD-334 SS-4]|uniref:Uncharacterized protein n=1 Tax=Hypholoma sublateritium (strain FD-334 SS-4) TaxID=945553 RepID=A0A0D2NZT2_HYPSF|nr:hypothetical protein HYPSUDRAFT_202485 [Hypholoma sublateritium FD-334 SS-4]
MSTNRQTPSKQTAGGIGIFEELLTERTTTSNEIKQFIIERENTLERLECEETEKERLLVQISNLKINFAKETQARSMNVELKNEVERLLKESEEALASLKDELNTGKTATSNEIRQLMIERDNALERLECGETEKERLLVQISNLEFTNPHLFVNGKSGSHKVV